MLRQRERDLTVEYLPREGDQQLEQINTLVVRMFALVTEGVSAATAAFLAGDRETARSVVAADRLIDELQSDLEELVEWRLVDTAALQPSEVRFLVSVLRIAPELERSGDLIEHIALRTPQRLTVDLSPRARGLVTQMARTARIMWCRAADAYIERDPSAVKPLRLLDDAIDDLHVELTDELSRGGVSLAVAIEMGLIARFYERLGDHAVNVARRIGYLANG